MGASAPLLGLRSARRSFPQINEPKISLFAITRFAHDNARFAGKKERERERERERSIDRKLKAVGTNESANNKR